MFLKQFSFGQSKNEMIKTIQTVIYVWILNEVGGHHNYYDDEKTI